MRRWRMSPILLQIVQHCVESVRILRTAVHSSSADETQCLHRQAAAIPKLKDLFDASDMLMPSNVLKRYNNCSAALHVPSRLFYVRHAFRRLKNAAMSLGRACIDWYSWKHIGSRYQEACTLQCTTAQFSLIRVCKGPSRSRLISTAPTMQLQAAPLWQTASITQPHALPHAAQRVLRCVSGMVNVYACSTTGQAKLQNA